MTMQEHFRNNKKNIEDQEILIENLKSEIWTKI